jgi:hypothetical protein
MSSWWRTHSLRVSLTAWYVVAMVVVLALYATVVFGIVSRNLSSHLDDLVRSDSQWASAVVRQRRERRRTLAPSLERREADLPDGQRGT